MAVKKAQKCTWYPNLEYDVKTCGVMLLFVSIEWRIKCNYHEWWRLDSPRGQNHVFFSPGFRKVKSLPAPCVISVFLLKVSLFGCFQNVRLLVLWRIVASPSVPLMDFLASTSHDMYIFKLERSNAIILSYSFHLLRHFRFCRPFWIFQIQPVFDRKLRFKYVNDAYFRS